MFIIGGAFPTAVLNEDVRFLIHMWVQMMSLDTRWKVYFLMGQGSVAFTLYSLDLALSLNANSEHYSSTLWLCLTMTAIFVVVGAVHFYTAYAFKFGRVDEVVGSSHAAVLIRMNKRVKENARIQLARNYDPENKSLTDDQRLVLFICDWRPWVCSLEKFRCKDCLPRKPK